MAYLLGDYTGVLLVAEENEGDGKYCLTSALSLGSLKLVLDGSASTRFSVEPLPHESVVALENNLQRGRLSRL